MPLLLLLLVGLLAGPATAQAPAPAPTSFWAKQLGYPRVRTAYARCWPTLAAQLQAQHLDSARLEVFFRLIKTRRALEVWARNQGEPAFRQLRSYPLAATSGTLGPKRRAGDGQVPEGFYTIDRFNPQSTYHLSLGLNYPTADDILATGLADPGGDIFLHGADVTVGCLPLTNAGIEEVYLLAVAARAAGQASISVHLFPFPLVDSELRQRMASTRLFGGDWRQVTPILRRTGRCPPPGCQLSTPRRRRPRGRSGLQEC